jgi:type IV pilus assembly protein PilW
MTPLPSTPYHQRGLTLIEMMIALVLGLIVIAGVGSVFLANRQVYRNAEGLSRIQENIRTAFELLARDLRETGGTTCDPSGTLTNSNWWNSWGLRVYPGATEFPAGMPQFGSVAARRVNGSQALILSGTNGLPASVSTHSGTTITTQAAHGLPTDGYLLICNPLSSTGQLFLASGGSSTTITDSAGAVPSTFGRNSELSRFSSQGWFIGCNGRSACDQETGRSLYRIQFINSSAQTQEIVEGVSAMALQFLRDGDAVYSATADTSGWTNTDWASVTAISVRLTFVEPGSEAASGIATDGNTARVNRQLTNVITLRNRMP